MAARSVYEGEMQGRRPRIHSPIGAAQLPWDRYRQYTVNSIPGLAHGCNLVLHKVGEKATPAHFHPVCKEMYYLIREGNFHQLE